MPERDKFALTAPTVHLNGTSRDELLDRLCEASFKLSAALDSLRDTAPNGRDYYPQGTKALGRAEREHEERVELVKKVKAQIDQLAEEVSIQE